MKKVFFSNMASKQSILEMDRFVRILFSGHQLQSFCREEDVIVLSTNSDGTRKTVWGPVFFRPTGSVVTIYHPDKPQRRFSKGLCIPIVPISAMYSKEWVKDDRWHNPVIQIKAFLPSYHEIPGLYSTYLSVFCLDTYYDDAGVCHWIVDTSYVDIIGLDNLFLPSEEGVWCLTQEEATRWVEVMIGLSPWNQVEENQVDLNLLTDSSIPLIWGPPRIIPCVRAKNYFNEFQRRIVEATKGTSYTVTKPERWDNYTHKVVLSIEKVVNDRSKFCGTHIEMNILFLLEVKGNVRKVIMYILDDSHAAVQ